MIGSEQFFFNLLRVPILQILKGIGFEKINNRSVDILVDLYIRYLQLITQECLRLSNTDNRMDVELQDITQALINLRIIRPASIIDPYDVHSVETDMGFLEFIRWIKSSGNKKIARISKPGLEMVPMASTAVATAASTGADGDSKELRDDISKKGSEQEKSVIENGLPSGDMMLASGTHAMKNVDWIQYMAKMQPKMDFEQRLKQTVIASTVGSLDNANDSNTDYQEEDTNDFRIIGPVPPRYLIDTLPCRKRLLQEMN